MTTMQLPHAVASSFLNKRGQEKDKKNVKKGKSLALKMQLPKHAQTPTGHAP